MSTDKEIEQKIESEFEAWQNEVIQNNGGVDFPDFIEPEEVFTAAALPREKRIRELEEELVASDKRYRDISNRLVELMKDRTFRHRFKDKDVLEKENEELREALDWATSIKGLFQDTIDKYEEIRAKFNLDKEGVK